MLQVGTDWERWMGPQAPGTTLGARRVLRPSGHVLQPFPVRAGPHGGHGGGRARVNSGLKKCLVHRNLFCRGACGMAPGLSLPCCLPRCPNICCPHPAPIAGGMLGLMVVCKAVSMLSSTCVSAYIPFTCISLEQPMWKYKLTTFFKVTSNVGCGLWVTTL